MKKVIIAIKNTLVCEAVLGALKRKGFFAEASLSQSPDKIAETCEVFFADVLLMDVGRAEENAFDRRMEAVMRAAKSNPSLKIGLLCDNVSDPEAARKVKQAKETGLIDVFFYESVQSDYLCDIVDSL
ncbi:MAG: hypothetical protein ACI4SC_00290 [Candidatus Neoclostridium sp.]